MTGDEALARLDAWCAEDPERFVTTMTRTVDGERRATVTLFAGQLQDVVAVQSDPCPSLPDAVQQLIDRGDL